MMNHTQLDVWNTSMEIVEYVYRFSNFFPSNEVFGLTSQIRRAAVSVSCNIAEGVGRSTKKDTSHFLHIARGSLYELDTLLRVARLREYIALEVFEELQGKTLSCLKLLQGLMKRYKSPELR